MTEYFEGEHKTYDIETILFVIIAALSTVFSFNHFILLAVEMVNITIAYAAIFIAIIANDPSRVASPAASTKTFSETFSSITGAFLSTLLSSLPII